MIRLFLSFACVVLFSSSLYAEGLNSAPGNDLPLGAGDEGPYLIIKEGSNLVGIKTAAPQTTLEVNGGLRVGAEATCTSAKTGTLSYNGGVLNVCTSAGWKALPAKP